MSLVLAIRGSRFSKAKKQNAVGGVTTEPLLTLRATSLLDPPHKALGGDHPGYAVASVRRMRRRIVATIPTALALNGRGASGSCTWPTDDPQGSGPGLQLIRGAGDRSPAYLPAERPDEADRRLPLGILGEIEKDSGL